MEMVNMSETTNKSRISRGPISRGSSLTFPRRGITPSLFPTADASLNTRDAIEGGPNIEAEHGAAVGKRRGGVVVDDVSEFFACLWTMDNPVASIEWWLGAIGTSSKVRRS